MEEKCLEFYFNENEYNEQKEQELIKQIKKEERVKEVKLDVNRNEWGIYIVKANIYQRKFGTFAYENKSENHKVKNKKTKGKIEEVIFSKPESVKKETIKINKEKIIIVKPEEILNKPVNDNKKSKDKQKKIKQTKYEKYTNKTYGVYQSQGQFKPY